jgi:hypothetical protein
VSQNSQRDWDFLLQGWSSIFGTPGQIYVGANMMRTVAAVDMSFELRFLRIR